MSSKPTADPGISENIAEAEQSPLPVVSAKSPPATPSGRGLPKPIRNAVGMLLFLLSVAALAIILLSAPAVREVNFKGEIAQFSLPTTVQFAMPEVSEVHLRRIEVEVSRIAELSGGGVHHTRDVRQFDALSLQDDNSEAGSSIRLRILPRKGATSVTAPEGTTLQAVANHGGNALSVCYLPFSERPVRMTVEADEIAVTDANRVILHSGAATSNVLPSAGEPFQLLNRSRMVHLEASCKDECTVELTSDREISALQGQSAMVVPPKVPIHLEKFLVQSATVHGTKDSDLTLNIPANLEITPEDGFVWSSILLVANKSPEGAGSIQLAARGKVSSVRQDGREVLPSLAADLFTASPLQRGIFGGCAVVLVLAWGTLLKRALDLLAKKILPE